MPYGIIKVDTITFTDNSVDKTVSISGLVQNPTFTGNVTATGTISGNVIRGGTTISGETITGTTANFVSGVFTSNIILNNQADALFREATANGTNYVGFQAPAAVSTDVLWTLPSGDGTSNQVLKTNGSGTLNWSTPTSLGLVIALS